MSRTKINFTNDSQDLEFFAGDDLNIIIDYTDDADAPIDIAGFTFDSKILDERGGEVVSLSAVKSDPIPSGFNTRVVLSLTEAQTAALQTDGKEGRCLSWYCSTTIAGTTTTPYQGNVILRFK